jgi:hypothetical protein
LRKVRSAPYSDPKETGAASHRSGQQATIQAHRSNDRYTTRIHALERRALRVGITGMAFAERSQFLLLFASYRFDRDKALDRLWPCCVAPAVWLSLYVSAEKSAAWSRSALDVERSGIDLASTLGSRAQQMRGSLLSLLALLALVSGSAQAQADYQAGTFRCYKPGPDEDKASVWRITVANDNIHVPFVELTSPSVAAAQPFTIRSYGTVTELPAGTVVSVSAPFRGGRYFNLIFEKDGIRMGDIPCRKVD